MTARWQWASEARLVAAAASGDAAAQENVCLRHHDDLYRYLRSMLGNREDAEDALQSTLVKALGALPRARPRDLRPWLFTIAHNEAVGVVRRRPAETPLDPEQARPGLDVHEIAHERLELATLLDDIAELPERQRAALLMRELGGLDHRAIASALGISEASARHAVYEARRALTRCAASRSTSCDAIRLMLSDGDARRRRGSAVRAHLRTCVGCCEFADALQTRPARLRALLAPFSLLSGAGGGAVATKTAVVVATLSIAAGALTLEVRRPEPEPPRTAAERTAPEPAGERVRVVARRRGAGGTRRRTTAASPARAPRSRRAPATPAPVTQTPASDEAKAAETERGRPAATPTAQPSATPPRESVAVGTPQQGPVPETSAEASEEGASICIGPCDEEGLPLP